MMIMMERMVRREVWSLESTAQLREMVMEGRYSKALDLVGRTPGDVRNGVIMMTTSEANDLHHVGADLDRDRGTETEMDEQGTGIVDTIPALGLARDRETGRGGQEVEIAGVTKTKVARDAEATTIDREVVKGHPGGDEVEVGVDLVHDRRSKAGGEREVNDSDERLAGLKISTQRSYLNAQESKAQII